MAAFQLPASIPPMTLDAGCTITFEAIDPDTGAAVTGVTISSATIYATNVVGSEPVAPPDETLTLEQLDGPPITA